MATAVLQKGLFARPKKIMTILKPAVKVGRILSSALPLTVQLELNVLPMFDAVTNLTQSSAFAVLTRALSHFIIKVTSYNLSRVVEGPAL